ncbi:leucine-rich repeat, cysteine-containing subtype protein [Tanacetum coccineum]
MLTRATRQQREWMIQIEQVFNCVIPYVHDVDDRNSISLVCRRLYELDGITRKHVTVHVLYCPNPSRLSQRFPFIDSLTLKGFPFDYIWQFSRRHNRITPWIKEIAVKFTCLKELQIRGLFVNGEDLETLATSRGKDLRVLKINKCGGLWEDGLVHVAKYCNQLRTLSLEGCGLWEDGKWLHELAIHNSVLESFHCRFKYGRYDVQDLTILARKCSKSLVSLKIHPCSLSLLRDAFRHALRLEDFSGAYYGKHKDYVDFKFPPNMCSFGTYELHVTGLLSLLPLANQLKELNLQCENTGPNCCCFLVKRCPNLEVLYTDDRCEDRGMQIIGLFCKKLRKFTHAGRVTHMGLIALAHGCHDLEYIKVRELRDISNEAMECLGTHLRNLRNFSVKNCGKTDVPLDNGIRAMLTGCNKLERLDIILRLEGLTNVGLGYIGKYGHNLKYLSLECIGESDAGLVELSKGCPKLRKLRLKNCPFSEQAVATFVFNMHSLRYVCVESSYRTVLTLTRPDIEL